MTITFANYPVHWIGEACTTACRGLIQPAACSPAGAVCAVVLRVGCSHQEDAGSWLPGSWLLVPGSWLLANWSRGQHSSCLVSGHSNHHLPRINCSGSEAHHCSNHPLAASVVRCRLGSNSYNGQLWSNISTTFLLSYATTSTRSHCMMQCC